MATLRLRSARAIGALGLVVMSGLACQGLAGESRSADQAARSKPAPRPAPTARGRAPSGPFTPLAVTGTERIEWRQDARTFKEVAGYKYVAYVGQVELELTDAKCEQRPPKGPFYCTAQLPPIPPGPHSIRIAAVAGSTTGPRSRPVLVLKQE
jgi:hypothetical protein